MAERVSPYSYIPSFFIRLHCEDKRSLVSSGVAAVPATRQPARTEAQQKSMEQIVNQRKRCEPLMFGSYPWRDVN